MVLLSMFSYLALTVGTEASPAIRALIAIGMGVGGRLHTG